MRVFHLFSFLRPIVQRLGLDFFARPLHLEQQPVLGQRDIFIMPSAAGGVVLIAWAVILAAAINFANALAYVFSFLLLSLIILAALLSQRNLLGLVLGPVRAEPVHADQSAMLYVSLRNPAEEARYAIVLQTRAATSAAITIASGSQRIGVPLPLLPRGQHGWPALRLSSVAPFGLFRVWSRWLTQSGGHWIYPACVASKVMYARSSAASDKAGQGLTQPGYEFDGLRPFVPGDSPRHISWKAYAAGRGMQAKVFQRQALAGHMLDWYACPGSDGERRLGMLAHALSQLDREDAEVGLILPDQILDLRRGAVHRCACWQALANTRLPQ